MFNFENVEPSEKLVATLNAMAPCIAEAAAQFTERPVSDFLLVQFDPAVSHFHEPGQYTKKEFRAEDGCLAGLSIHPLAIVDCAQGIQERSPHVFDAYQNMQGVLFLAGLEVLAEVVTSADVSFPRTPENIATIRENAFASYAASVGWSG